MPSLLLNNSVVGSNGRKPVFTSSVSLTPPLLSLLYLYIFECTDMAVPWISAYRHHPLSTPACHLPPPNCRSFSSLAPIVPRFLQHVYASTVPQCLVQQRSIYNYMYCPLICLFVPHFLPCIHWLTPYRFRSPAPTRCRRRSFRVIYVEGWWIP